jgi:hypothetical protein
MVCVVILSAYSRPTLLSVPDELSLSPQKLKTHVMSLLSL